MIWILIIDIHDFHYRQLIILLMLVEIKVHSGRISEVEDIL